jgi:hypothetical protein
MNNFIDNGTDRFFFVIYPDIEDEIILLISVMPMCNLILILNISGIDSFPGNKSGQLESVLGMFIQDINIEIEQEDKGDID